MPLVSATRAKQGPNLLSLSRMRYFGVCPYGVASRSCCAVHASVGDRVTPTWITLRDLSSIMKNTKSDRKKRSVTCKKSQAQISAAWLCRKVAHFWSLGRGRRTCLIYFWIVRQAPAKTQLEQLASDALSSPESILTCHLLDQCDCFWRELRLSRSCLCLVLPEQTEQFPMPPCAWSPAVQ